MLLQKSVICMLRFEKTVINFKKGSNVKILIHLQKQLLSLTFLSIEGKSVFFQIKKKQTTLF